MSFKSNSLNLWAVEDDATKVDIDCHTDRLDITSTGSQVIKIHPALHLVDGVNGDIADVAQKLHDNTSAIASGNAGSAAASTLVQTNLDAYQSANDLALATLSATVTSNKAITDAEAVSDANDRATLNTNLTGLISAEETRALAAEALLTSTLSTEVANRTTAISDEATSRINGDTTLQTAIDVEKGRIDAILSGSSVNLDSFLEVVNAYEGADVSILSTIATIQTDITNLQNILNELTSSGNLTQILFTGTGLHTVEGATHGTYGKIILRGTDMANAISYTPSNGDTLTLLDLAGDTWVFVVDAIVNSSASQVEISAQATPTRNGSPMPGHLSDFGDDATVSESYTIDYA